MKFTINDSTKEITFEEVVTLKQVADFVRSHPSFEGYRVKFEVTYNLPYQPLPFNPVLGPSKDNPPPPNYPWDNPIIYNTSDRVRFEFDHGTSNLHTNCLINDRTETGIKDGGIDELI